jgi:hypothetical protein
MNIIYLLLILLLASCATKPVKQEKTITPLREVMSNVKIGMNLNEVNDTLVGHKPKLKFTAIDSGRFLWEFNERNIVKSSNSIDNTSAIIIFNNENKVIDLNSSSCSLPDQEPKMTGSPCTKCYQKQIYYFDKELIYNAIKRFLIISNYQVEHSDAASEIITALGTHKVEGDDDKMMFIKLTVIFTAKEEKMTEVIMSASFSISEKQSNFVQAGFAGVSIPVPIPFQHKTEWINTGIVTPRFYLDFYDALSSLIASEYLAYQEPKVKVIPSVSNTSTPDPVIKTANNVQQFPVVPREVNGTEDSDYELKKSKPKEIPTNNEPNNQKIIPEIKRATDVDSDLAKPNPTDKLTKNESDKTKSTPESKGEMDIDSNLEKSSTMNKPSQQKIEAVVEEQIEPLRP